MHKNKLVNLKRQIVPLMSPPFESLRDAVLSVNGGHAYLVQQHARMLAIIPSLGALPTVHPWLSCSFCNDDAFKAAAARGDRTVALKSPHGNILVVPITKYASLQQFARKASVEEFKETMLFALRLRDALHQAQGLSYTLETHGHDVPHFHIRLMAPTNRTMHPQRNNGEKRWKVPHLQHIH